MKTKVLVVALMLAAAVAAKEPPPTADTRAYLLQQADRVNAIERRERQAYYQRLVESEGAQDETFDEHLARYGSLAALGPVATDPDVEALRPLTALPLPAELVAFYRDVGGFKGGSRLGDTVVHAPQDLLAAHRPEAPRWQALRSIGLVDMIRWSWGNDRPEFDADSGEGLSAKEVARLNAAYAVAGWRVVDGGEAFEYLYFDGAGRFGTLHYHQDAFGDLYVEALEPMLTHSPADSTLHAALVRLLEAPPSFDPSD